MKSTTQHILSFSLLAALSLISEATLAQTRGAPQQAPAAPQAPKQDDRLDVSDLEKKYWAAKDTDFSVVQNRTYTKAGRFSLSGGYGTALNDTWSSNPTYDLMANYYFTDRYGIQLEYSSTSSKDNGAAERLIAQNGYPNHNKYKQFYGAAFNWVPIYAKMSLLNSNIIYFDMAISPGLGMTEYEQQMDIGNARVWTPTATLDISQHYFLSKYFALRLDFKNRWYQEDLMIYRLPTGSSASSTRKTSTDWTYMNFVLFGFTILF